MFALWLMSVSCFSLSLPCRPDCSWDVWQGDDTTSSDRSQISFDGGDVLALVIRLQVDCVQNASHLCDSEPPRKNCLHWLIPVLWVLGCEQQVPPSERVSCLYQVRPICPAGTFYIPSQFFHLLSRRRLLMIISTIKT